VIDSIDLSDDNLRGFQIRVRILYYSRQALILREK